MRDRQDTGALHALLSIPESELKGALTRALDLLDLGCFIYGDGKIVYANRAVERLVGRSADELARADVFELLTPDDREIARARQKARQAGAEEPFRYVLQLQRGPDEVRSIELSLAKLQYRGNDWMLALIQDVTESRAVEERVRQSQKMAALGKLAQGVAHAFSSYLTAIRLTSEALALRVNDPEARELLAELEQVISGARRLTQQLVTFGGQGATQPTVVDVNVVVFEVLQMVQRLLGESLEIVPELEPGVPPVRGDEGQLQQVVMNLALNAGDAMPDGGKITIRTGVDEQHRVVISVTDEGSGMQPQVLERAFEPFFSTKGPQSAGLGLAIVYGIVSQCGGEAWLESKEGVGTTASVALPAAAPPFPPVRHRQGGQGLQEAAARVLLVEDEAFVRRLLVEGLERMGFVVRAAADGNEAMTLIEEFDADVLVTDVVMPGATGEEVASRFRERHPNAAIVFVSGYPNNLDQGGFDTKGTFLPKPFSAQELAEAITESLAATR